MFDYLILVLVIFNLMISAVVIYLYYRKELPPLRPSKVIKKGKVKPINKRPRIVILEEEDLHKREQDND